MEEEKYPVGTEVYYSLDDFDSGEPVIYKGVIKAIHRNDIKLGPHPKDPKGMPTILKDAKFYEVNDGLSLMCNAFYTLDELFELKDRLELLMHETNKQRLLNMKEEEMS